MSYQQLYKTIGYEFRNPQLLDLAFIHRSKSQELNYERLEFFGDRVLSFCLAKKLYEDFPDDDEGKLARRFASLARQETLAEIARTLELSKYIQLSHGEEKAGGMHKDSVLADTVESLLAAICLDSGITQAEAFVQKFWNPYFNEPGLEKKDPRSLLQEIAQKMGKELPVYSVIEVSGEEHRPEYIMKVKVEGYKSVQATGSSKRNAAHAAAEKLLKIILRKEKK